MSLLETFIKDHRITVVEGLVPDMSGIARGRIRPADKFLHILRDRGLRMPEAIFVQTVPVTLPAYETYPQLISSSERENLLLNV